MPDILTLNSCTDVLADWSIPGGSVNVYEVLDNWQLIMGNSTKIDTGFIVLEHDLFEQTVDVATGYILPQALAHQPKYNMTPIVECLNMPLANAYIETNDNASHPLPLGMFINVQRTSRCALIVLTLAANVTPVSTASSSSSGAASTGSSSSGKGSGANGDSSSQSNGSIGSMIVSPMLLSIVMGAATGAAALFL